MLSKKTIISSIVIISFLFAQFPASALAKYYAAGQDDAQVTRNAPHFKTTAPEPIAKPTPKAGEKKHTLLWGLAGLAAVAGLVAAVMSGGGGGGGDDGKSTDTETGSVTVEW
jgi:hypothetical protein